MALNIDVAVIRDMIIEGLVGGGDDKQAVCEKVKEFRLKEDKKGLAKYLADLREERILTKKAGDNTDNIVELLKTIKTLTNRIEVLESSKGTKDITNNIKGGQS